MHLVPGMVRTEATNTVVQFSITKYASHPLVISSKTASFNMSQSKPSQTLQPRNSFDLTPGNFLKVSNYSGPAQIVRNLWLVIILFTSTKWPPGKLLANITLLPSHNWIRLYRTFCLVEND
jgi:hypothetical protein